MGERRRRQGELLDFQHHVKLEGTITPSRSKVAERRDIKSDESDFVTLNLKYLRVLASAAHILKLDQYTED